MAHYRVLSNELPAFELAIKRLISFVNHRQARIGSLYLIVKLRVNRLLRLSFSESLARRAARNSCSNARE